MGAVGDIVGEFKQARPPEKILIVGGVVAVAIIAYVIYRRGQAQSAQSATTSGTPGQQQGGIPSVSLGNGQVPLLPSDVKPIFDNAGNVIGFQQSPTQTPTSTTPPTTPNPVGTPKPKTGPAKKLPIKTQTNRAPIQSVPLRHPGPAPIKSTSVPATKLSLSASEEHLANTPPRLLKSGIRVGGGTDFASSNPLNIAMISRQQTLLASKYARFGRR